MGQYLHLNMLNTLLAGEGAKWNNFHKPGVVDDNFTLLDAIWMLLLDAFLYMLIAWYVDNVHPGEYGVAQPFYFPFTVSKIYIVICMLSPEL